MSDAMTRVSRAMLDESKRLSQRLEDIAGEPVTHCLFVFTGQRVQYSESTKDRAAIKRAMLACIRHWDEGQPDIPAQEVN